MAVEWQKDDARPGWGPALVIGIPLLLVGAASPIFTLLGLGAMWYCVGTGSVATSLRAKLSGGDKGAPATQPERAGNLRGARDLAAKLRAGKEIDTVTPSFRLHEGELQHARFEGVKLYEWFGVDVPYKTIHNRAFHPVGWAIDATVHKAINKRNRERAEAAAAPTWRETASGTLHLTSRRIVLDDGIQMRSWWFSAIVATEAEGDALFVRLEDELAVLLRVDQAYLVRVALHHLAWKEIVDLPADAA